MLVSSTPKGFSLMEVMIGVFLSTLLITAITSLLGGSVSAYRLQIGQGQLEASGRYARDVLMTQIAHAGFQPRPWQQQPGLPALTDESIDGDVSPGDQLGLQRWSIKNCYGNENPVKDKDGRAEFYLLQVRFRVDRANNLALTCRYGPRASQLQTQINNLGLVENVESMQILYAEDRNGDEVTDGWIPAQTWQRERNIRAVKIALLLSTHQVFGQATAQRIGLLDETLITPADGRLRRITTLTTAIRGRLN